MDILKIRTHRKRFSLKFLGAGAVISLLCGVSFAKLLVTPMVISLQGGLSPQMKTVQIVNQGKHTQYVSVELERVYHPGFTHYSIKKYQHQNPYEFGLVIAPQKMILQPGEHQMLRFVNLGENQSQDRVYVATITPSVGIDEPVSLPNSNVHASVTLLQAFGVTVIARPKDIHPRIVMAQKNNQIHMTNTGNTTLFIIDIFECPSSSSPYSSCKIIPKPINYFYPRVSVMIPLPVDRSSGEIRLETRADDQYYNYSLLFKGKEATPVEVH